MPNMSVQKMMLKCYFLFFFITILNQETSLSLNLPILILHNLFSKLERKSIKFKILKNIFYIFFLWKCLIESYKKNFSYIFTDDF